MTHYQTSHSHISPDGPEGLIETDHLHYLIGRLKHSQQICLGQLYGPPPRRWHRHPRRFVYRWLQAARDLARLGRELFVLETHNHVIKTKWEMLRDPEWRARVIRDLGGGRALQMWERRFAKAKIKEPVPQLYGPPQILPAPDKKLPLFPKSKTVKTDSRGQFRLAPIETGARPRKLTITKRGFRTYSWDPSWETRERTFPPIPVTVDELRTDSHHNPHPEADTSEDVSETRRTRIVAHEATDPSRRPFGPPARRPGQDEEYIYDEGTD